LSPSQIGNQNNVGSDPGAKGAQLRGVEIHHPHPNPQLNHCIIASTPSKIPLTFSVTLVRFDVIPPEELNLSSLSGIPSLSRSLLISNSFS